MAISIKSPLESIAGKGSNTATNSGKESEPGYQQRTPGAGGPKQKVYENIAPKGNLNIKTPATTSNGRK